MSTLGAPLPSPQEWCRKLLPALRGAQDRASVHVEMLLTTFIELDPSADEFGELLTRYANDTRPDIADAAKLLLQAWMRVASPQSQAGDKATNEAIQ
jgi:hypothetical protein